MAAIICFYLVKTRTVLGRESGRFRGICRIVSFFLVAFRPKPERTCTLW